MKKISSKDISADITEYAGDANDVLRMLEQSPVGISIASHTANRRIYTNPRFNQMFSGDPTHSMINVNVADTFVNPSDFEEFRNIILNDKYDDSMEYLRRRLDGEEWWCLQTWRPAPDWGDGAYMVWHFDITERKVASEELKKQAREMEILTNDLQNAKRELEYLNDQKNKFFSILAHDLKSPFDGLLGFSDLLSKQANEFSADKVKNYASYIHTSAEGIYELLVNLLDWSRLQMKQTGMKIDVRQVDLQQLVISNLAIYKLMAESKNVHLVNEVDKAFMVPADGEMLNTILRNLLNNALKFSSDGGTVSVNAKHEEDEIIISVKDEGVGMSDDQIANLFLLDKRSSTLGTSGETGTGLGLQLCKEMIEAHGGKLTVKSKKGQGTKFQFSLPKE